MPKIVTVQYLSSSRSSSQALKCSFSHLRDFYSLDLERSRVVFFPSVWTIVHPIDNNSPLFTLTRDDLLNKDAEFIATVKAYDESSQNMVYSRSSYKACEISWGEKFKYLGTRNHKTLTVDVSGINQTDSAKLNT